ncbi:MAG: arginine--tRNA ligase [Roseburia sp.]|nr:arginine--tRNA ligase [Roseburia sp.]
MRKLADTLKEKLEAAFENAGYDKKYGFVTISNRPDLCQYQCNGAMAAAKEYKKAPIQIAGDVLQFLKEDSAFEKIEAVNPGFINITVSGGLLADLMGRMMTEEKFGLEREEAPKKVMIDYGGANVAKPLHVGHLRPAIIGEAIKRIYRYMGDDILGDAHLGDWGLQIGLVITELKKRQPELPYFDEKFSGEYPEEAPFTISDLEEIYPHASAYSKENAEYMKEAQEETAKFQEGDRGRRALWNHILNVSMKHLKQNYEKLNVDFDLWKKESDVQEYIPDMIEKMKADGVAYESEGALVVDVTEESDKKELPPCIVVKSNGATLYATTDLATIVERERLFAPEEIIYVADKRQSLHFTQVFRTAKKAGLTGADTELVFIGNGTMNGKDGKPFKTRDGGVLSLQALREQVNDEVYKKIKENRDYEETEAREIAEKVGLAALKYGDLSNQASKDYIFDIERFTSFEGNTGPYILYTIVRIKSLLAKYVQAGGSVSESGEAECLRAPENESETNLYLALSKFADAVQAAYSERAPHKICQFIYELSESFNRFYHENQILSNKEEQKKTSYIQLLILVKNVLEQCIDLIGLSAPERM